MKNPHLKKGNSKILGAGGFGTVYQGKYNDQDVAIKRIEKERLDTQNVNRISEEDTMRKLNHPNVLKLVDVDEDEDFKYIVMELCVSTLHRYIIGEDTGYQITMPTESNALYQMACGLQHIHEMALVHRDITPQNVLIQCCNNQLAILKISDFGFCKPASERGSFSISKGGKGTIHFIAPEMLHEEQRRATIACDIFSLGCLFYRFLTKGGHPFSRGDELSININIRSGHHNLDDPENSQLFARTIIKEMIEREPTHRLKIHDVVRMLELLPMAQGNQ